MENKRTPGNWYVAARDMGLTIDVMSDAGGVGRVVFEPFDVPADNAKRKGKPDRKEAMANARLIAAAPELLAAARAASVLLSDPNAEEYFDTVAVVRALEAAISKTKEGGK